MTSLEPTAVRPDRRFAIGGEARSAPKLGTFLGVFTPTVLTILGVIMYLRFGWVVGNVGLALALSIAILANCITLVTTLSFSAIATNTRVGVGGAYFIISRSLGLEIGGAIGIPLYLSQVFSVTLYAFGLAESFRFVLPWLPVNITAFVIIVAVGALSLKGAGAAMKAQIPIMVMVGISVLALGVGVALYPQVTAPTDAPELPPTVPYWTAFAVYFPAVTGVMAGLGLSGDLQDPRTSIPRGSIAATVTGFVVYLGIVVLLAFGADSYTLRTEPLVWTKIALGGPFLVMLGMWGAIFSSAVGSILNAPRTLQALVRDHTPPHSRLGRLANATYSGEPVWGLALSTLLALGAVFLGDLNTVAEVVTMFYLTVYGAVNLVAALESMSGDASWRPTLRVPWIFSLAAGVASFAVMFLINPVAGVAAIAIELVLWLAFQRIERRADWGDMRRDIYEALIRWALVKLRSRPITARNWRPHILLFVDDISRRLDLVRFSNWFSQERGVVTVCELVEGDVLETAIDLNARRQTMNKVLDENGLVVFGEVNMVQHVERGIVDMAQASGIAGLDSNTVVLGWPNPDNLVRFVGLLRRMEKLNKSVIIGRPRASAPARQGRRRGIHVWWGGLERNGDLMLLLAHLLTRNPEWRDADIQVSSVASNDNTRADTESMLRALLPEARIDARTHVLVRPQDKSIRDVIHAESAQADVVFLGLATPAPGDEEAYARRLNDLAEGLGTVFFVKNNSPFVGKLAT